MNAHDMRAKNESELREELSGLLRYERFLTQKLTFFGVGAAAMSLLTFMQYRFPWWPIHPIPTSSSWTVTPSPERPVTVPPA